MVLSEEARNEIAWKYLVNRAMEQNVNELRAVKLCDRLRGFLKNGLERHRIICDDESMRKFCNDAFTAVLRRLKEMDDNDDFAHAVHTQYQLCEARRMEIGYIYLLYSKNNEESVRIGKNLKREIHAKVRGLGISADEADAFYKMFLPDLVEVALN